MGEYDHHSKNNQILHDEQNRFQFTIPINYDIDILGDITINTHMIYPDVQLEYFNTFLFANIPYLFFGEFCYVPLYHSIAILGCPYYVISMYTRIARVRFFIYS